MTFSVSRHQAYDDGIPVFLYLTVSFCSAFARTKYDLSRPLRLVLPAVENGQDVAAAVPGFISKCSVLAHVYPFKALEPAANIQFF